MISIMSFVIFHQLADEKKLINCFSIFFFWSTGITQSILNHTINLLVAKGN